MMKKLITLFLSLYGISTSYAVLQSPVALPATDVTNNSFTANWQSVENASSYILNVFSYKMTDSGTEKATLTESFEGLVPLSSTSKRNKYIDFENSELPEGWTLAVTSGSVRQLYTASVANDLTSIHSGEIALAFDAEGDSIVTPLLSAPASKLSFWIKNANGNGSVSVYAFDGTRWEPIGQVETVYYTNGGTVEYTNEIPVGCIQFKLIYTDNSPEMNSPTAIDDISITYGGEVKTRDYLVSEKSITATSEPVSGLTPDTDYFYTVKSTDGNETSLESNIVDVFAFAGELKKPELKDFTDIEPGQYTANWNSVVGADGYALYNVYTHIAQQNEPAKVVLYENFDAFTGGTIDLPVDDIGTTNYDEYTTVPNWKAVFGCWTDGMLGGISVTTPAISMSNTNGFTIKARIYGAKGDKINFNNLGNSEKEMRILTKEGYNDITITFGQNSEITQIEIYFQQNDYMKEMYIDEFTITQDLAQGDQFSYDYDYLLVEGRRTNSYTFTELPQAWGDQFAFRMSAYAIADNKAYQSEWTELTNVPISAGISSTTLDENGVKIISATGHTVIRLSQAQEINIYDLQGRIVWQQQGEEGDNTVTLNPGLYLLRCGNYCAKFVSR